MCLSRSGTYKLEAGTTWGNALGYDGLLTVYDPYPAYSFAKKMKERLLVWGSARLWTWPIADLLLYFTLNNTPLFLLRCIFCPFLQQKSGLRGEKVVTRYALIKGPDTLISERTSHPSPWYWTFSIFFHFLLVKALSKHENYEMQIRLMGV